MKISNIFVLFTLCVIVKGWVALLQPIVLSLGAALAAFNLDVDLLSDIQISKFDPRWKPDKEDLEREIP